MLKIAVGSKNPVKVEAVKAAFAAYWPELELESIGSEVNSGVSHQPLSDDETIKGATNRAKAALKYDSDAAYGVGIEGGMQELDGKWFDTQWAVVINREGKISIGQGVRIPVPNSMMKMIHQGMELGDVIDKVFNQTNMKQAGGYINEVTQGIINREQMVFGAVVSALIPFANPDLFQEG
jgi:inosine/xanthosine triphosphatase